MPHTVGSPFQILTLDGGGARALFTAHVMSRLEDDLQVDLLSSFDLVAGTSAGGIIALALGMGLQPREVASSYASLVSSVFPASGTSVERLPLRFFRPAYRAAQLEAALQQTFGDTRLGDSTKRLVIPAWNARVGNVHLFKTAHHPSLTRDHRLLMRDVALATSAAPTYFSAARVDDQRFVDGGVWANNPSAVAVAEAVGVLGVPLSDIRVLNIGTTQPHTDHKKSLDQGGLLSWAPHAVNLILDAGGKGAQGIVRHLVGDAHYQRFDAEVPAGRFSIDRIDETELRGWASSASRRLSPIYTEHFAEHRAEPFLPTQIR